MTHADLSSVSPAIAATRRLPPSRRREALHPGSISVHEALKEVSRSGVRDLPVGIDETVREVNVDLGLSQSGHVEVSKNATEMLLHGSRSDRADRRACDADWFARPGVLTVGTRRPVKRVLECGRDRTVILGRDEHDAVCSLDLRFQANDRFRRVLIVILIEYGQIVDA